MSFILAYELTAEGEKALEITAASPDQLTSKLPPGFYTTFRTLAGGTKVLGLRAHLDRLYQPAAAQGIRPAVSQHELRRMLARLAGQNAPSESRVRLVLSASDPPGAVFAILQPFLPPPVEVYQQGVHTLTREMPRRNPRLKSTGFIASSQEARQLIGNDVFEVLITSRGHILEGMTSNFYAVQGGTLVTARRGVLLGVTRRTILRLARAGGITIEYRAPNINEDFEEAFITSSSRGVVPVVMINGRPVGEGRPGSVTKQLMEAYDGYVLRAAEQIYPDFVSSGLDLFCSKIS